jgi:hypothetical protein
MRPWIKLATDIVADTNFRRLSIAAKATFPICLAYAGRCDRNGLLGERTGPLEVRDICEATRLSIDEQELALDELVTSRFLTSNPCGYKVRNWTRYQPKIDRTAAERQVRFKQRHPDHNGVAAEVSNDDSTLVENRTRKKNKKTPRSPLPSRRRSGGLQHVSLAGASAIESLRKKLGADLPVTQVDTLDAESSKPEISQ